MRAVGKLSPFFYILFMGQVPLRIALNRTIFVYLLDIGVTDSSRHRRFRILACVVYGGQGGAVSLLAEKAQFWGRDGFGRGIFVFEAGLMFDFDVKVYLCFALC